MRTVGNDLRWMIAAPLVLFLAVNGVSLWFIDLISRQGEFAGLLAAELVAFALLLYLERIPSYREASIVWLIAGCAFLVIFLVIAML